METAALCKPIQRFADLLRIPDTWVLTGLGKLLAALGSFPHFPQPLRLLHTHLYWRFLECQSIEVTLTQNGHLTHHEIPSVASLRPGGHFPRIGWPVSPGIRRIVAIAVNNLAGEVSGVVAQLILDVGKLRVELVVLLPLGFVQVFIQRHGFAPESSSLSATSSRYLSRLCSPPTSALCYIIPIPKGYTRIQVAVRSLNVTMPAGGARVLGWPARVPRGLP